MKNKFLAALFGLLLIFRNQALAADDPALAADVNDLVAKVKALAAGGARDERDYTSLLKKADDMVAQHKDQKTDQVAQILYLKAAIYIQLTTNADHIDKALEAVGELRQDFPNTKLGMSVDKLAGSLKEAKKAEAVQASIVSGAPFPDFNEMDFDGKPVSVSAHKGKVVLIDFWATWCGPCRAEFPNVKKTYEQYHDKGFDIIGVSLDQDKSKLADFIKENGVTWPQYFDGQGWANKLAAKYGIQSIPATILVDADGKILGKDLRGEELAPAVAKALAGKGGV